MATKKRHQREAEVIACQAMGEHLRVLLVRPAQPLSFHPGQYVKVSIVGLQRRYSLVSAPHEAALELCIAQVPGGAITARVWALRGGDRIAVRRKAKGHLRLDLRFPAHVMVVTGTGVSPFVSMVCAYCRPDSGATPFTCCMGRVSTRTCPITLS